MVIFSPRFMIWFSYIIYNVHVVILVSKWRIVAFLNGFHVFNDGLFNTQTCLCSRSVGVESFHRARV